MRQLYYTIQTLLRGRGSNVVKTVSLTLGLFVGILLFSQIAYEFSYENFYQDPERLVMLRMRNTKDGISEKGYNYGTYRPAAADLWEAMPEQVECASLTSNFFQATFYKDGKKLEDTPMLCVDTLYFRTTGLEVLKGNPNDLALMQNAFISQSMARRIFGDEDPIGKELSVEKMFNVTIRGIYREVPRNTNFPHEILLSDAVLDWGYGAGTWGTNNIYHILFRLKQPSDVDIMNRRVQKAVEQYTDPHLGESVVTEYSVIPIREIHRTMKFEQVAEVVRRINSYGNVHQHLDLIAANNLREEGAGFGTATNLLTLITAERETPLPLLSKDEAAHRLLDELLALRSTRT